MEISFKSSKLQKTCNSAKGAVLEWGVINGGRVCQRLAELHAVETLDEMRKLPAARCHPLKGDRLGQFAVDVKYPFRLIFEIAQDPVPRKDSGEVDLQLITHIGILAVENYHGN